MATSHIKEKSKLNLIISQHEFGVLFSAAEGFGNVIPEYIACGVWPVVCDMPWGPRGCIRHTGSGTVLDWNWGDSKKIILENCRRFFQTSRIKADIISLKRLLNFMVTDNLRIFYISPYTNLDSTNTKQIHVRSMVSAFGKKASVGGGVFKDARSKAFTDGVDQSAFVKIPFFSAPGIYFLQFICTLLSYLPSTIGVGKFMGETCARLIGFQKLGLKTP